MHNIFILFKCTIVFLSIILGCVRMNYISPETGIAINVSYGDSMLHSAIVKGPDPEPTCLSIFTKLAQMCARFSELLPTDDGLRGCVNLEPMLLGEVSVFHTYVLHIDKFVTFFFIGSIRVAGWLLSNGAKRNACYRIIG